PPPAAARAPGGPARRRVGAFRPLGPALAPCRDADARPGLAQPDDVARLEQAFAGQAPAVQEGAVQTGEVFQQPPRHAVTDLQMKAGHDTRALSRKYDGALGAATETRDIVAHFGYVPRREL